jgi:hypothetical protein
MATRKKAQLRRGLTLGCWVDAEWLSYEQALAICRLLAMGVSVNPIDRGWMEAALTADSLCRQRSEQG